MVSDRRQHCEKAVVPVCQRKETELVKDVLLLGDCGKKPVEVLLVDALGKESDNFKEVAYIGSKCEECRGSK
jgi:hypothetical protein